MTPRRPVLALAAVSALLAACGPAKHLNLDLRAVAITVPRLVTPAITIVPVAPVPPPAALPPLPAIRTQLPPPSTTPNLTPAPPAPTCPKAGEFAVPAVTASLLFTNPPAPATYAVNASGTYNTTAGNGSLSGTDTETIKALPRTTSSVGQVVDAWSVTRSDAAGKTASVELYRLVHPSTDPTATSAGIYLVGLAWNDPVRGTLSYQASGNGLWILPDPVAIAQQVGGQEAQYESTDTDGNSLTTLTLVRNVTDKKRVDACGQLIDTYTVAMSGVLTTRDTQRQVAWTQQLATSYGGLDVQDTLSLSSATGDFRWQRTQTATTLPKPVAP